MLDGSLRKSTHSLEKKENENITYHNLLDMIKAILRGKVITLNDYITKSDKCQLNNLIHLEALYNKYKPNSKLIDEKLSLKSRHKSMKRK